jgi:hypothetical protein
LVVRGLPLISPGNEISGTLLLMAGSGAIDRSDGLLFESAPIPLDPPVGP